MSEHDMTEHLDEQDKGDCSEVWKAIARCQNYLPKSLYDALCEKFTAFECSWNEHVESEAHCGKASTNSEFAAKHVHRDGLRIFVHYEHPPIPIRTFDWVAHYDDAEGPAGNGTTPYMAILDLINNYSPTERATI